MDNYYISSFTPDNNNFGGPLRNINNNLLSLSLTNILITNNKRFVLTGFIIYTAIGTTIVFTIIGGIIFWYLLQNIKQKNLIVLIIIAINIFKKH